MGSITTTRLLTFEEFERMPEQPGKQELLEGELIELPPAELDHNESSHQIYDLMMPALRAAHARGEAPKLGRVYHEMGYKLAPDTYVQPDVSISHAEQPRGKYFDLAPAIAIEVISPGNRARDVELKTDLYFQHGALEVWRFYPRTRHVVVHVGTTARVERETVSTPLLPGFTLTLADVFDRPKL